MKNISTEEQIYSMAKHKKMLCYKQKQLLLWFRNLKALDKFKKKRNNGLSLSVACEPG